MLDSEVVEHVSRLARLTLSDEEKDKMRVELSKTLEHFRALSELDTSAIPPTAQVIPIENNMREDAVGDCLPKDDVLANAPRTRGDYIRVPAVLKAF